jgi:hypothetical protein
MERLGQLLEKYNLSSYTFTNDVIVEDKVIPHSHPILTLNSFPYNDQKMHLTDLIHEQLHWYLEGKQEDVNKAVVKLKTKYPNVPIGHPFGCSNETSTYEHLLLCRLCHLAAIDLLGNKDADAILHYLQNHHYLWVYKTIEDDSAYLDFIIEEFNLAI